MILASAMDGPKEKVTVRAVVAIVAAAGAAVAAAAVPA
jgi:hypothetical protein